MPSSRRLRADMLSSRRTGTWETSLTLLVGTTGLSFSGGAETVPSSSSASQREVLHSRGQCRTVPGPQALEVLVPGLEVPDLEVAALPDEHHLAGDAGEAAQLGRDQQAPGGVGRDVFGESHQQPLPHGELAVEGGK